MHPDPRQLLRTLFDAAIAAAHPERCVPPQLPPPPSPPGRTVVVGAGKATAAMAQAVERHWPGGAPMARNSPLSGAVVTRYGHALPCRVIEVFEARHPLPDAAGVAATERILAHCSDLTRHDLVLALISGGGSALLCRPAAGLKLADLQDVHRQLLHAGARIDEINCVRKHLSAVQGGHLARHCHPARVHTLVISDVPGDDAATVASGPTFADPGSAADALAVLERHRIKVADAIRDGLRQGLLETPFPDELAAHRLEHRIVASNATALEAAAREAAGNGIETRILGDALEGEARALGAAHATLLYDIAATEKRSAPLLLLSGGETTVTVGGDGRGGPNTEYLLGLAAALGAGGAPLSVWGLACDSDGIDGSEDNAGAFLAPDTAARAAQHNLDPRLFLARNDSYGFFRALDDLLVCGPTHTNVNDFRALYLEPS